MEADGFYDFAEILSHKLSMFKNVSILNYLFIYLIHIQNKILVLEISKSVKIGYEWR